MEIKNVSTILSTCPQITTSSRKTKLRKIITSFIKVERDKVIK